MQDLWNRLVDWQRRNAPAGKLRLRPPAPASAIAAAEEAMNLSFPADFRE
jgi:cell wall assembly regulator SMI1